MRGKRLGMYGNYYRCQCIQGGVSAGPLVFVAAMNEVTFRVQACVSTVCMRVADPVYDSAPRKWRMMRNKGSRLHLDPAVQIKLIDVANGAADVHTWLRIDKLVCIPLTPRLTEGVGSAIAICIQDQRRPYVRT